MRIHIKKHILVFIQIILLPAIAIGGKQKSPYVTSLQCEHLNNPIGIDARSPRLSWTLVDDRPGAAQKYFQLIVGTDSLAVVAGKGNMWQTTHLAGKQELAVYGGKSLIPFSRYYWRVIVWSSIDNRAISSGVGSFETGMMDEHNWKGNWISDNKNISEKAAPYFRHGFTVNKKIISARAYITAAGLFELYVNGQKIGDHHLDPIYTRFDRRNLYVTHDITTALQKGQNAVGVWLGNGWYNFQSIGVWNFERAPWRNRPAFCMDVRITYSDGTTEVIGTDNDWKTALSPLIYNSIYTGEHYDANMEQPNWGKAGFDDSKWQHAIYRQAPSPVITAQAMVPIRHMEMLKPVNMQKLSDTSYLFDFGRNIAGVTQITLNGQANTTVRVIHAEKLKNGLPDQSNVDYFLSAPTRKDDPFATDIYILNGKGPQTFMPHFNYKGFQYAEVISNRPITIGINDISAYFMHSDVSAVGSIITSSQLLNKIYAATNASYLSNLFGYPTDCPQREKNGWTGDAHIASETGLYNFDAITVYEKWMADHRDEQQPNGVLPSIIPTDGWGYDWGNGPDWTSSIAIIPWNVYLFYGDSKILSDNYDAIKRYVDHITQKYPTGLTTWGLGDWAPVKSKTPVELTSSVYYYVDANILAQTAKLLGKQADYKNYTALATKIKTAINTKYLNPKTALYGDGHQTEQCVPLYWGIVPENLRAKAAAHLADSVAANHDHLDVGILGAKALLGALSDNGQAETAFRLATQTTHPSWGWWIMNGATTLYENWDITRQRDLSLNHIMFGEIGAWMYKTLGGIHIDESAPGFKHFILQPQFVSGLTSFKASHRSPYGNIISNWERQPYGIRYTVTIPANTSALIKLPADKKIYCNGQFISSNAQAISKPAGTYIFDVRN